MVLNSLSNPVSLHEILFKIFIGNRINLSVEAIFSDSTIIIINVNCRYSSDTSITTTACD